jgi:hypothetical protein
MISNYLLSNQDYTIYNALTWGNYLGHYDRACAEGPFSERVFHGIVAIIELTPILSQIFSLFEMAIAYLFRPPSALADLARREIRHIESQESILPHQNRAITSLASSSDVIDIALPEQIENLAETLFPLHRKIEGLYCDLPWPVQMQKIVVFTKVQGGRGDIAAAAKAITFMQQICPTLTFDWVLLGAMHDQYNPQSFLHCRDPSKVQIRDCPSQPFETSSGDFLLVGPVKNDYAIEAIARLISRRIAGPSCGFMENAEDILTFIPEVLQSVVEKTSPDKIYQTLHSYVFPSKLGGLNRGCLPMGLQPGSGVFLDRGRIEAPLSRGYCCPSYLLQIQDVELRNDILESMHVFDGQSAPDYDQHSFNSGYAHRPASWGKFIDCVAIHEQNKHVVIVLNQRGEFANLATEQFQNQIFTPARLAFLKQKGYGTVILKGQGPTALALQDAEDPQLERCLTVIIRPSFAPSDMRQLQLASERLLGTGDNSALESWCARCKLYLYEDVANLGCKWRFLQQQVDFAQTISPNLSRLLALFGGDRRLPGVSVNETFSREEMSEIEQLLNDPDLSDATLHFCDHVTTNYSFDKVLEGALKRAAWHHCIPELASIEAETIDKEFFPELLAYLKNPNTSQKNLRVTTLPELKMRLKKTVWPN